MRHHVRPFLTALGLAVVVLLGAGPRAAADDDDSVPLNGTLQFRADPNPILVFPFLIQHNTFSGRLTSVGYVTGTALQVIDLLNGNLVATFTIVAVNGDKLFGAAAGQIDLTTGDIEESFVITGGTGRFAGATGSGTGTGGDVNGVPVESITGTLDLPDDDR
jgi:hypothetical protein